jgi:hypothetical protein
VETESKHSCSSIPGVVFGRPTTIVTVLIIALALIFLSGIGIEKRVEVHIIVTKYRALERVHQTFKEYDENI